MIVDTPVDHAAAADTLATYEGVVACLLAAMSLLAFLGLRTR